MAILFPSSIFLKVKNKVTKRCLDNMQHTESEEYTLSVYPCHNQLYPSQVSILVLFCFTTYVFVSAINLGIDVVCGLPHFSFCRPKPTQHNMYNII